MQCRHRQQARDCDAARSDRTIGQHQDPVAVTERPHRLVAHRPDRRDHAVALRVGDVDPAAVQAIAVEPLDRAKLRAAEHGRLEVELPAVAGSLRQQVPARTDRVAERGHQRLADVVQRRIGDLRELLQEIVAQRAWPRRQHGRWGIAAHGADRIRAGGRHGLYEDAQ
nr:hypothetical protein [Thioalkalivibrio nitratireducens]